MNRKIALLSLFMFVASYCLELSAVDRLSGVSAYYPDNFITTIENNSALIKDELFRVLTSKHQKNSGFSDTLVTSCPSGKSCYEQVRNQTYGEARKYLFGQIYLRQEGGEYVLDDVYCHDVFGSSTGVGRLSIPNPNVVNCEHTWPQSRFSSSFSSEMQKSDLHHLFATNSRANSTRGNYIFAEVKGSPVSSSCDESLIGTAIGTSERAFQPPFEHRGNVARALFYFSIRYKLPISATEEKYLRKWHAEDPVDSEEIRRHEMIFSIQKNRNPFIDMPKLVTQIKDF